MGGGRKRKKETNISAREITKFIQRVIINNNRNCGRRKKEKETNISKGSNKV